MTSGRCVFCRIVNKEISSSVVYEDGRYLAFLDIHPINEGHVLVIPKLHVERFIDGLEDQVAGLFAVAHKILKSFVGSSIKCEGANLFLSDGAVAGQEVPHVHLHIAPRFKGDGQNVGFSHSGPEQFPKTRLDKIAVELRSKISAKRPSDLIGVDHSRLFVLNVEQSKNWYAKILHVKPWYDTPEYVEFRVGSSGLAISASDEKSPYSTGGQVAYWKVSNLTAAIEFFVYQGAKIYRGPLDIENGEAICQIMDPFGSIVGLIGKRGGPK